MFALSFSFLCTIILSFLVGLVQALASCGVLLFCLFLSCLVFCYQNQSEIGSFSDSQPSLCCVLCFFLLRVILNVFFMAAFEREDEELCLAFCSWNCLQNLQCKNSILVFLMCFQAWSPLCTKWVTTEEVLTAILAIILISLSSSASLRTSSWLHPISDLNSLGDGDVTVDSTSLSSKVPATYTLVAWYDDTIEELCTTPLFPWWCLDRCRSFVQLFLLFQHCT